MIQNFLLKLFFIQEEKISENLKLMYSEGMVFVTDRKITVGELDNSVSYLLTALHEKYNKNFSVKISKLFLQRKIITCRYFNRTGFFI